MTLLLFLFVLQLGAATARDPGDDSPDAQGDDSPDKGQVMTERTTWRQYAVLERRAAADTGGDQKTPTQKMRDRFKSCADPELVCKEYNKLPDDMTIGNWIGFYRMHPIKEKSQELEKEATPMVSAKHPRLITPSAEEPKCDTIGEWFDFWRPHLRKEVGQELEKEATPMVSAKHPQPPSIVETTSPTQPTVRDRFYKYDQEHGSSELVRAYRQARSALRCKSMESEHIKRLLGAEDESLEREVQECVAAVNEAEKDILRAILCDDEDYCPDIATREAQNFSRAFSEDWRTRYWDFCAEENIGSFLQGLFSTLDPACRQKVWGFGARATYTGGLEQHLLELKYNPPVVAVAIVKAIWAQQTLVTARVVSQKQLYKTYNDLEKGRICVKKDDTCFFLGECFAERAKIFMDRARPAC